MTNEEQLREVELIRKFTNQVGLGLTPSNDTMEAVRLFRKALPDLLHQAELNWLTAQIERGEGMNVCEICNGETQQIIGENRVTLDMAIDAGDRSMEGMHHSFEYEPCHKCEATGKNLLLVSFLAPLIERKKEVEGRMCRSKEMGNGTCYCIPPCSPSPEKEIISK